MSGVDVVWSLVVDRRDLRCLQSFCCTTGYPHAPSGRRLRHPRPWEIEVQSYLRNSPKLLEGQMVLLGCRGEEVVAVARLDVSDGDDACEVFIACAAIALGYRRKDGGLADALMCQIRETAVEMCRESGKSEILLEGKIHPGNLPSQAMVTRAGFEPLEAPGLNSYEMWGVRFTVE